MTIKTVKTMTAPFQASDVVSYYAGHGYDVSGHAPKIEAALSAVSIHDIPLTRGACLAPVDEGDGVYFPMVFKSGDANAPIWGDGETVCIGFSA